MSEEMELPKGWIWTQVREIYEIVGGGTPPTNSEEYWKGDIPWITSADIYGLKDIQPRKHITKAAIANSATNLVPERSLIVVTRVGLGKVALTKTPLCFSQDSQALIDNSYSIYPDYSVYYLAQAVQVFKYQNRGTTIAGVTKKQLAELPFALPPFPEQHRIVAAIEQQFTRLDAGVAALQRAKARLKRYRAAVLKAAVEGKLTETWRAEHPATEPATLLLERILDERHAKWEADLRAKGKDPAKVKYIEPATPNTEKLPELPKEWCWVSLASLTARIGDVDHKMPKAITIGIPYVSTKDFRGESEIAFETAKRISYEDYCALSRKIKPENGDILLTRYGTIGEVRKVSTDIDLQASYSIAIIKTLPQPSLTDYLVYSLMSETIQSQIKRDIRASAQPDLGLEYIRLFAVPLPSLAEQEQIVAEVERRLSVIRELEITIEANLKRAERLRQSILREAFAGRLVLQDPTDEPASVLLERIRNERKNGQNASNKPGNGRHALRAPEPVTLDVTEAEQAALWESVER